jgi:hypothetical protein
MKKNFWPDSLPNTSLKLKVWVFQTW